MLSLSETLITGNDLNHLSKMVALKGLSLADTKIADDGLSHLEPAAERSKSWGWCRRLNPTNGKGFCHHPK
ncbi:MAG: hypothetical protein IH991_15085 [Planctomycetes bacterium]|nr:hypothetical protein [Planctomycetota bacterium]